MQYMESVSNEYLGYAEEQHCVDKLVNMTCKHCCQAPKEPLGLAGERSVIFVAGERTPAALTIVPHRVCAFVPKVAHSPHLSPWHLFLWQAYLFQGRSLSYT